MAERGVGHKPHARIDAGVVQVTVWDSSPVLPMAETADASRVGRHGLEIVRAVAQDFETHDDATGVTTTARIALAYDPSGTRP
ncbi:hypothetical protein AB0D40_34380 [Streptomyces massasporeus]|uniref:hypothetical protein n=1 Tax=Streptomyces massasporeus TaxID=67324 RepID=UPI0033F4F444